MRDVDESLFQSNIKKDRWTSKCSIYSLPSHAYSLLPVNSSSRSEPNFDVPLDTTLHFSAHPLLLFVNPVFRVACFQVLLVLRSDWRTCEYFKMDLKFQNEMTAFKNIRKTVASTFKIVTISAIHVVIHLSSQSAVL